MGIYFDTYVCNGTYSNCDEVVIVNKTSCVDRYGKPTSLADLESWNIGNVVRCVGNDVFIAESVWSTLDPGDMSLNWRYTLVAKNAKFIRHSVKRLLFIKN